jgi:para-nitrobenzyl esterase
MNRTDPTTRRADAAARAVIAALVLAAACTAVPTPNASLSGNPRVTIDAGTLEGRVDSGGRVLLFAGIPYAAPPVGELRWRPPRPAASWQGVRDAKQLGHNCTQHQPYGDIDPYKAGVSEDCLYLNIWTQSTSGSRPVMVWIHGGGFFAGFGGEERHNGAPLARKGAVVVTINYRLGPFGFFAHPALAADSPNHASGNYGLLDQIAALDWVRRNIAKFGGDPSRVTIFGESAGGMSVGTLIGSPLAKGLFQRAILESGVGTGGFVARTDSAQAMGARVAAALGVTGSDAATAARLRALPADSVLAATLRVAGNPGRPIFWPAIDGWVLPRSVDSTLVLGMGNVVPVIVGTNADEPQQVFGAPARAFARIIAARGAPAWLYQFTRVAEDSVNAKRGAYHSAEIVFVFGRSTPIDPGAGHTSYDSTLADAMSDYWVSFATSGDPNGPPAAGKWPRWPRYDPSTDTWMELGKQIVARPHLRQALYDSLDVEARTRGEVRP